MIPNTHECTVEVLAEELARYTGESVTIAIKIALRERLQRVRIERNFSPPLSDVLLRVGRECAALPVLDSRTPDKILGYDEQGLPT